jgi:hypothetical protein
MSVLIILAAMAATAVVVGTVAKIRYTARLGAICAWLANTPEGQQHLFWELMEPEVLAELVVELRNLDVPGAQTVAMAE